VQWCAPPVASGAAARIAAGSAEALIESSSMIPSGRRMTKSLDRAGPGGQAAARLLRTGSVAWALLAIGCSGGIDEGTRAALVAAVVPAEHRAGRDLFDVHCAVCHGPAATGTAVGPPLVHPVYRPRHHGDEAFQLAVTQGVRAHHWRYGDMAPVPDLDRDDVASIIRYVRWLQRSAGIE
jgi:mono/diheme cytochrome c family protein